MSAGRVVIIGGGQGGFQLAASLRQEGFSGTITLLGDEPGLPYQRPPLSKAFMQDGDEEKLLLRPASFYLRNAIDYRPGSRVTGIDRIRRTVRIKSEDCSYDHLILATGARNAAPPIAGLAAAIDSGGIFALRTIADAALLRQALASKRHAVIVGGGFIGLEFAAVACTAGLDVTVIEAADRLMARVVSSEISKTFLNAHREMGVTVMLNAKGQSVTPTGIELHDGTHVEGDLLLLAAGVQPNCEIASEAGLEIGNGIVVNEHLVTSDPAISAIGDCASFPMAEKHVRLESVQAAVDHARHVARRLVHGAGDGYKAVPWFWSDQAHLKLQIAGLRGVSDSHVSVHSEPGRTVILNFADERLTAVETINAGPSHMAARKLLARQPRVSRAELDAANYDLIRLSK